MKNTYLTVIALVLLASCENNTRLEQMTPPVVVVTMDCTAAGYGPCAVLRDAHGTVTVYRHETMAAAICASYQPGDTLR